MRRIGVLFLLLLAVAAAPAGAVEYRMVTAIGTASVIDGDVPQARDEAIADALASAAASVNGASVATRTLVGDELLEIDDTFLTTRGYARLLRITDEGLRNVGLYYVEALVEVFERVPEGAPELGVGDEAVLDIANFPCKVGADSSGYMLASELAATLSQAGIWIVPVEAASIHPKGARRRVFVATSSGVRPGEQLAEGFHSARAWGEVSISEGDGALFLHRRHDGVRGFGLTPSDAARDASRRLITAVLGDLRSVLPTEARQIRVSVTGLPDAGVYLKFKALLGGFRWTGAIEDDGFNSLRTTYRLRYREGIDLLVARLARTPGYRVTRSGPDFVEVWIKPLHGRNDGGS